MEPIDIISSTLREIQDSILHQLMELDPDLSIREDSWQRAEGGGGRTRALCNGSVIEKGGVNFSLVEGKSLPASATKDRPGLTGVPYCATGVSVVLHPQNPYVPTSHMNVRFFSTKGDNPVWWFGGGFDLTPFYPFSEDVVEWHQNARRVCETLSPEAYPAYKKACDEYFFLPHRNECRGVGGLFFDDLSQPNFESIFPFWKEVGSSFLPAWSSIARKRMQIPYGDDERSFQLYRRGRYVEFNLIYDRGTHFGLQSKGRTESILVSLPSPVTWEYDRRDDPDSPEAKLQDFLTPRDWLQH